MLFSAPQHPAVQQVFSLADSVSLRFNSGSITLPHVLIGILRQYEAERTSRFWQRQKNPSIAARILQQHGISAHKIEDRLSFGPLSTEAHRPALWDADVQLAYHLAEHELHWMDQRELNVGHLLLGILLTPNGCVLLESLGLRKWRQTIDNLRNALQFSDEEGQRRRPSRYTRSARLVLVFAQEQAQLLRHSSLGTEHLLLAMLSEFQGLGGKVLKNLGVDIESLKAKILQIQPAETSSVDVLGLSENYKRLLDRASNERRLRHHSLISTGHLLYHMLFLEDDVGLRALRRLNIRMEDILVCLAQYIEPQVPLLEAVVDGIVKLNDRLFTLTFEAQDAFLLAQSEAQRLEHRTINTAHLMMALMLEESSLTSHLLSSIGLNRRRLRGVIETMSVQDARQRYQAYRLSDDLQTTVHLAIDAACDNCHYPVVNPLHLLMGILMQPDSVALQLLRSMSVNVSRLLMIVERELSQRKR
ncbi:MAG: hypothetical protein CUN55_06195 [Phototrophicales bacterium]|nr:MAG: hypothetical protein CUN55_06195 [Phototrophicales bacterium]